MITHVPMLTHKNPRRVLVVGGGDGGVLRELIKYPLDEIYFVEIDREIVEVAKKYLSFVNRGAFRDKRIKFFFEDGKKFIRRYNNFFDVAIIDSTDPVGPGKVLFGLPFYRMLVNSLKKDGVAMFQVGPFLDFDLIIKPVARKLKSLFSYVKPVRLPMPSYSCGCEYCFMIACRNTNPLKLTSSLIGRRLNLRLRHKAKLRYYSPQMHLASMVMPEFWQI
jgi:spermidine synthase